MSRYIKQTIPDTESFICIHCGSYIIPPSNGTSQRNHCPHCLWSCHMDLSPGDRRSGCRQPMEPIGIWVKPDGEWAIIHRCRACGFLRHNRVSGDDSEQVLLHLAMKPRENLPFPESSFEEEAGYGA